MEKQRSASLPTTRRCTICSDCSCRACILGRWSASTANETRRGVRLDASDNSSASNRSQSGENASVRLSEREPRSFRGFQLTRTTEHYIPLNGRGPSLTCAVRELAGGGTETDLNLEHMKLSLLEQTASSADGPPESLVTVSRRMRRVGESDLSDVTWEIVYSARAVSRGRTTSLDALADAYHQIRRTSERGDASSVMSLLEAEAKSHGTTAKELLLEVSRVAPLPVADALASVCQSY